MSFIANLLGLGWLWHWITSWWDILLAYGTAGLVIAGLVALAILAPWFNLKQRIACIIAAAVIVYGTVMLTIGIKKGADRVKADWDWALGVEAEQGEQHRTEAERAVHVEPAGSGVLADDPWNRDRWPK